jgi:peptide/nickel transport system permease protein
MSTAAPTFVAARSEVPSAPPPAVAAPRLRAQTVLLAASLTLIGALVVCALFPDAVAPYRAGEMQADAILTPPLSRGHWLGTDQFGRDVLSLVVFGSRQSLVLASLATLSSVTVGVFLGLTAGYAAGVVDMVVMRLVDIWLAIPAVLLGIAICTALSPTLSTLVASVTAALAPRYARVVRGQALALRGRGFIEAARVSGASHLSIVLKHVLPHCAGPILVMGTLGTGWAILIGSALSFLGLGVNGDRPDWAYLISQGRGYMTTAWWTVTFPGVAIGAFVVAMNLLGDALRRRWDPRGREG